MPSQSPLAPGSGPHGLPPVAPPSGKFLAQLFLVPLLIVAAIALFFVVFLWLFGGSFGGLGGTRSPAQLLEKLDRGNPEVRWRAASDLAQVLLRDDRLASDPRFALDLAERLQRTLKDADPSEQAITRRLRSHPHLAERLGKLIQGEPDPKRNPDDPEWKALEPEWKALEKDWKTLEPDIYYSAYLGACLGNFSLPVGAPLLSKIASREEAEPNLIAVLQRRKAVWALAKLGENLKRFDKLAPERQAEILDTLREEAVAARGNRAEWAERALKDLEGRPRATDVDLALIRCAEERQDPFLRQLAGFAMSFWEGTADENQRMDGALLRLLSDPGEGDETLARLSENPENRDKASKPITRKEGLRIHYNAAAALARRGSAQSPLPILEEMLNEQTQLDSHRLLRPDGRDTPDKAMAYLTVVTALKCVTELHHKNPDLKLGQRQSLLAAVDTLKQSENAPVRAEAERTRFALTPSE